MKHLRLLLAAVVLSGCIFSGSGDDIDAGVDMSDPRDDMGDLGDIGDMAVGDDGVTPDTDVPDVGDCPPQTAADVVVNLSDDAQSDGMCDCTCTLRDALEAVAPDGTIGFAVPTNTLTRPVAVATSGIVLDGGAERVSLSGDVEGALLSVAPTASGVTISSLDLAGGTTGLSVDGAGHEVRAVVVTGAQVGIVVQGSGILLEGVEAHGARFGAVVTPGAEDVTFDGFITAGGAHHGLHILAGLGAVEVRNSEVTGFGGHGISARRSNLVIEDSLIAGNALHGIFVDSPVNPPNTEIVIRGNEIGQANRPNGLSGVEVVRAGNITVGGDERTDTDCTDSCNVVGHNRVGIHIQAAAQAQIAGNYVGVDRDGTTARPNGAGIVVGSQARPDIDSIDGLVADGFMRRGIGGACAHTGDCVRDADFDGDGTVDQYECIAERIDPSDESLSYPGGMCTGACSSNADCGGGVCVGQLCFSACSQESDCRRGYTCFDGSCRWAPGETPPTREAALQETVDRVRIGRTGAMPQTNCVGACNVVAGNEGDGIDVVAGDDVTINGNLIGAVPTPTSNVGNGTALDAHQGIVIHAPADTTLSSRAVVSGNVVGENAGVGVLARAPADIRQNWIGLAPDGSTTRSNRIGVLVGGGLDGAVVDANTIAGVSLHGVTVAQGATGVVVANNVIGRTAQGDPVAAPFETGLRIADLGTQAELADNIIVAPTLHGITVGIGSTPTQMSNVVVQRNEVLAGSAIAGIEVYGCADCTFEGNTIVDTEGPGLLVGDPSATDFTSTVFGNNVVRLVGESANIFQSGVVFRGGIGATFEANTVEDPTDAAFVLGTGADIQMSGTRFIGNQMTCNLNGFCQGPGFRVLSGYGATLEANVIDGPLDFGIDFVDAVSGFASVGMWENVIVDASNTPIDFDGVGDDDDVADGDHGMNTLLNAPVWGQINSGPLMITAAGTTNFAGARVDIYRTDDTFDYPFEEHVAQCLSAKGTPETFVCNIPRSGIGAVLTNLQATVSGRHFIIGIGVGSVTANSQIAVSSALWGGTSFSTPNGMSPAAFAAFVATSLRADLPEILAAESTTYCPTGMTACVHVVSGAGETTFSATGGTIFRTEDRGWVTSRMVDDFAVVP